MTIKKQLIVGTRGSALALVQAEMTEGLLRKAFPGLEVVRKVITTTGDRRTDVSLKEVAKVEGVYDKGVFIKELELALETGEIDIAVHSLKDVPTVLEEQFEIVSVLERAPVADVLVTKGEGGLESLREGAVVATSSVRRQKMLQFLRPDISVTDVRGNVPTRLRKLAEDEGLDGILLAQAGLMRLGYDAEGRMETEAGDVYGALVPPEDFLPAAGQGAVGLEIRAGDEESAAFARAICHVETLVRVTAEREFLRLLDGGCHTPVGVTSELEKGELRMRAIVFPEGDEAGAPKRAEMWGGADEPLILARNLFGALA